MRFKNYGILFLLALFFPRPSPLDHIKDPEEKKNIVKLPGNNALDSIGAEAGILIQKRLNHQSFQMTNGKFDPCDSARSLGKQL